MPKTVIGIIGVDTLQNVTERTPQAALEAMVKPFEGDFKAATQGFVASMFLEDADPLLLHWVKEDMSSAPKSVALSAFRNYLGQYVSGEAAAVFSDIDVPVVSLNAKLWPTAAEANQQHIKNYHLLYIEGTGHFPMLENPAAFNRSLAQAIGLVSSNAE